MQYQVTHTTTYAYSDPVSLCQNLAHLIPRSAPGQRCLKTHLEITPEPAVRSELVDYFGNPATFFTVQEPHRELVVNAEHLIELNPLVPPDPSASPPWEAVRDGLRCDRSPEALDAYQFVFASRYTPLRPELHVYALSSFAPNRLAVGSGAGSDGAHIAFVYDRR